MITLCVETKHLHPVWGCTVIFDPHLPVGEGHVKMKDLKYYSFSIMKIIS